jgi:hypothetical protein
VQRFTARCRVPLIQASYGNAVSEQVGWPRPSSSSRGDHRTCRHQTHHNHSHTYCRGPRRFYGARVVTINPSSARPRSGTR